MGPMHHPIEYGMSHGRIMYVDKSVRIVVGQKRQTIPATAVEVRNGVDRGCCHVRGFVLLTARTLAFAQRSYVGTTPRGLAPPSSRHEGRTRK